MPRKDQIHEAVKNALVKDGWTVTNDPCRIHYMDVDVYADLRVEKLAEETGQRRALVIEIKTFSAPSSVHEMETALGQYMLYRTFLRQIAPEEEIYLAISETVFKELFARKSFQLIVQDNQVAMLIVNLDREEIVQWID